MTTDPLDAFIFMKVGSHAGESLEDILVRKNREYSSTGMIFWGYGGTSCHPLSQAQPFARLHAKKRGGVYLVMQSIFSQADPDIVPATQYSADGVTWVDIPEGISVTGSRYAFILDEIKPNSLEMNPSEFVVDVGPSRGKSAEEYLRGHVDKACLIRSSAGAVREVAPKKIDFVAQLKDPYAVLLR